MTKLTTRTIGALLLGATCALQATPKYDSTNDTVRLFTSVGGPYDIGSMTIYAEDHIRIGANKLDGTGKKLVVLCALDPSLGFIVLNRRMTRDLAPPVTEVKSYKGAPEWASQYVFRGDAAYALMDLMYEHRSVGFLTTNGPCEKVDDYGKFATGKLRVEFETKGLERAMERMKAARDH